MIQFSVPVLIIETVYDLPQKNLFEHGYARLDSIKSEAASQAIGKESEKTHYLLAPSWGPNGTIETGLGSKIVDLLMSNNSKVTLRPHPQTIKFAKDKVMSIVDAHKDNLDFEYENNVQGQNSLHTSNVMICDWSGAALDYAFGLNKPVLFIDVERKVNNPDFESIPIVPFEVSIRNQIGKVISPDNLEEILNYQVKPLKNDLAETHVFNIGRADKVGGEEIIRIVEDIAARPSES